MINRTNTRLLVAAAALLMAPVSWAQLAPYSQNFEALAIASPTALGTAVGGAGFQIFGTVFDGDTVTSPPYGLRRFGYGPFSAPNASSAPPGQIMFSAIATGEGGVPQGAQYLNVYNDYNCCGPSGLGVPQGHNDVSLDLVYDYVESVVFQEQTIAAANVGQAWTLTFDAKLPASNGCDTAPASDCIAFIKTLDNVSFNVINQITFNAQTLSNVNWSTHSVTISLVGAVAGQILQFGFASQAQKFGNTGAFYDNISFAPATDTDGDGVPDPFDNCRLVANNLPGDVPGTAPAVKKSQLDSDNDGYGNRCDGDFNQSPTPVGTKNVDTTDYTIFRSVINKPYTFSNFAARSDLNASGTVDTTDYSIFRTLINKLPGPSGLACAGTIPCP